MSSVLLVIAAGVVSLVLTGVVRRYALRRNLLDHPNERSSHTAPTPRGGGVAIVISAALALIIGGALGFAAWNDVIALTAGMAALAFIGWLDDTRGMKAGVRLTVHVLVAAWTLYRFGGLPQLRVGTHVMPLGVIGYALGAIGIVWSINLFNFMDGIDGIAGSQAVLIFGAAGALCAWSGETSLSFVSFALCAACAGFLVWNWPPAKIFMGDVASGAIGYLVAGLAIASENRGAVPLVAFAVMGGAFVADATITLLRRYRRKQRLTEAHRDHAYQRMSRTVGRHLPVTLATSGLTLVLIAFAAVLSVIPRLVFAMVLAAIICIAAVLLQVERRAPLT